jgi:hypothetical protein
MVNAKNNFTRASFVMVDIAVVLGVQSAVFSNSEMTVVMHYLIM